MRTIKKSVGRRGINEPDDVREVQFLLNRVPASEGGPKAHHKQNGECTEKLIKDIQVFQLHHFGWSGADGRVDPGHQTIAKLNEYSAGPLTTTRFLLKQMSPNEGLRPGRKVDWYFEVSPIDGDTKSKKSIMWMGPPNQWVGTMPAEPSRYENTKLITTTPVQASDLVGPASFVTFYTRHGKKSRLRINMAQGVALAEFQNNHWRGDYHFKHLETATKHRTGVYQGKFAHLASMPFDAKPRLVRMPA